MCKAQWHNFLKKFFMNLNSLIHSLDWRELLESCSDLLTNVGEEVPDENLYKLKITDMALDASVHLGRWEEALSFGVKTLPAYRLGSVCVCVPVKEILYFYLNFVLLTSSDI